ncbi:MAG TPA: alpha-hydroxy acid oxidase [Ktedonobacterales bacterium]|nr:alpha-hydroxy acid oxidase [Ktedonobacterales bacterium]
MEPINVYDYEALAEQRLAPGAWAFYSSGAGDEVTLRRNRAAFERIQLLPRILTGYGAADTATTVLGTPVGLPILVAPTAAHGMACAEAECATARGAGEASTLMVAATESTRSIEEIAAAATGPLWSQLYVYRGHRPLAESLVRRAEATGCRALVLTVDAPLWGSKDRSARVPADWPPAANLGELDDSELGPEPLTWADLDWLRSLTAMPLVVKGVLLPDDALRALDHGAAAIVVSNHGGRQLDGVPASIEALPAIIETVAGRCQVYLDGGVRRGTDVLKALALGARAVLVGRPALWGLAVDGAAGVRHVLELLRNELEEAMVLAGVGSIAEIDGSLVRWS